MAAWDRHGQHGPSLSRDEAEAGYKGLVVNAGDSSQAEVGEGFGAPAARGSGMSLQRGLNRGRC